MRYSEGTAAAQGGVEAATQILRRGPELANVLIGTFPGSLRVLEGTQRGLLKGTFPPGHYRVFAGVIEAYSTGTLMGTLSLL